MAGPIDRHEIDQLVVEHLPVALRLARRLVGDADVAEEIVQEALCRVLDRWKSFRGESSFRTWMLQIVVNVDRDRRRQVRETSDVPTETFAANTDDPIRHAEAAELSKRIRIAIDNLPDRQREVVLLCIGEGLEAGEVALILKTTVANVHACLHHARKQIASSVGITYSRRK